MVFFFGWSAIEPPKEWREKDREEMEDWTEKIKETAKENNVQIETKIVQIPMSVEEAIVVYAEKENIDLIVVGTRGRTGFAKKLLGSVALGVVTHASCPVTVVKEQVGGLWYPTLLKMFHSHVIFNIT
ncbi:MAG: universal stress protein [Nitrososphaeraceae archaeon]